jgi:RND family efflux transporter MFP subunit
VAIGPLVAALVACTDAPEPPGPPAIRSIKGFEIAAPADSRERLIAGIVAPARHAKLSFEVPGQLVELDVEIGDRVNEGQILARLDRAPYRLAARSVEAQLKQARAVSANESKTYDRLRRLYQERAISKQDLDEAAASADAARAKVNTVAAELRLARRDVANTVLRAPFDGVVAERMAEPHEELAAGQPILVLETEDELEVELAVPETLYRFLESGDPVSVSFPVLDDLVIPGTIKQLGSRAAPANAFPATIRLDKQDKRLHPGMTAEVGFSFTFSSTRAAFAIPITALVAGSGQAHHVFVYDEDSSSVQRIDVQVHDFDDDRAHVSGDLEPGDILAAAGAELLADGQQVKLMESQPGRAMRGAP